MPVKVTTFGLAMGDTTQIGVALFCVALPKVAKASSLGLLLVVWQVML